MTRRSRVSHSPMRMELRAPNPERTWSEVANWWKPIAEEVAGLEVAAAVGVAVVAVVVVVVAKAVAVVELAKWVAAI